MSGSVTVVVPCYNYGRYLRQCVDSILAQDVDLNVDIIDDASTDDSERVGSTLATEDGRVTYQRHAHNAGHIATYNEGLGRAVGTYSLLLSADDLLAPGALRRAVDVLENYPDVVLLYGEWVQFRDTPPPMVASLAVPAMRIWDGAEFVEQCCRTVWNPISAPTAIVRTSVQKSAGGYYPSLPHSGDMEMWLRLATRGRVAELRGVIQAYYRVHDKNMHRKWSDFLLSDRELRAAYEIFFADQAAFIENRDEIQLQCYQGLAERSIWWSWNKLRRGQFRGALDCLWHSVSAWSGRPEDEIGISDLINVVKPISYAVRQRHHRKRDRHSGLAAL